jgi:AI-2 transport protein TqsA
MTKLDSKPSGTGLLVSMAAFMIVVAGLRSASDLVVQFLLALFIAFICGPIFFFLQRKNVPKAIALILVLLIILGFGALLGVFIGTSVNDFTRTLPTYQENFIRMLTGFISWLGSKGIDVPSEAILDIFNMNLVMNLIGGFLTTLTSMLSDSFLILLIVFFILLEASTIPQKVISIWGEDSLTMDEMRKFAASMQQYIAIKTMISLITGLIVGMVLFFIGVDFALLWGVVAFLLNYIPTIGSILASVPPILLALIQLGWGSALMVLALYLTINNLIGSIIEPRVMGKELGISPLVVLISVLFWGWVLGPIGMLLSVPLTMSIKIYMESRSSTRWLGIILSRSASSKE